MSSSFSSEQQQRKSIEKAPIFKTIDRTPFFIQETETTVSGYWFEQTLLNEKYLYISICKSTEQKKKEYEKKPTRSSVLLTEEAAIALKDALQLQIDLLRAKRAALGVIKNSTTNIALVKLCKACAINLALF